MLFWYLLGSQLRLLRSFVTKLDFCCFWFHTLPACLGRSLSRQFQDKLAAELLLFKEQLRFVFSKRRLRELLVDDCVRAECCVFESRLNPALYFSNVPRCSIKQVLDVRKILAYETCLLRLCLALFAMRHLCLLLLHLLAPSHLRTQVLRQPDVELGSVR